MTNIIETRNISKSFRRGTSVNHVLKGADLQVQRGEVVILAGPSGSGKTTLLSIVGCTLSPDEGELWFLGNELSQLPDSQLEAIRRDHIGFLFQKFHLIRGLSALENVTLPLILNNVGRRRATRLATEQLESVGLADHLHADPRQMSGGQCQRIAFARALVTNPDLILADEPTASLDAVNGEAAMHMIRNLTKHAGKTAIVVSHDPRIMHFADRVIHLSDGRISDKGEPTGVGAKLRNPASSDWQVPSTLLGSGR